MDNAVLIIEDDELNHKLVADLLQMRGIGSVQSLSTDDVEALVEIHNPCLILLNARIAGPAELKIARFLKSHPTIKRIPIVLLMAYSDAHSRHLCSASGCDDFLSKPLEINDFYGTVDKFLAAAPLAVAS